MRWARTATPKSMPGLSQESLSCIGRHLQSLCRERRPLPPCRPEVMRGVAVGECCVRWAFGIAIKVAIARNQLEGSGAGRRGSRNVVLSEGLNFLSKPVSPIFFAMNTIEDARSQIHIYKTRSYPRFYYHTRILGISRNYLRFGSRQPCFQKEERTSNRGWVG